MAFEIERWRSEVRDWWAEHRGREIQAVAQKNPRAREFFFPQIPASRNKEYEMNQTNQFLDLEIRIDPRQDDAYPVEIALGSGQEFSGRLAASILPCIYR